MPQSQPAPTQALDLPPGPWTTNQALDVFGRYMETITPPPAVVEGWKQALAANPGLWRVMGDLAWQARTHMLETYAPHVLNREAIRAGAEGLARDLGRPDAPPLEQLLIDQVVVCWINVYAVQQGYTNIHKGEYSMRVSEHWEKRLSAAQKRYLRACELLAKVRKLSAVTPLQVNIGGQQINVAGTVQTGQ